MSKTYWAVVNKHGGMVITYGGALVSTTKRGAYEDLEAIQFNDERMVDTRRVVKVRIEIVEDEA